MPIGFWTFWAWDAYAQSFAGDTEISSPPHSRHKG
jgi:hypothetical protein